ncbi:MAG: isoprenylcysteine carboxylmethyltransferase family protein [Syntrophomonadaceae bacterium]|nr:isoprenylcysteine carboxylmethyltransferase family protein [Syntrophomonadaceae bacterium]
MATRHRNVMIRMLISLGIFAYIAYLSRRWLPPADFYVIIAFFGVFLAWSVVETAIYQPPETAAIEDEDRQSYLFLQLSSFAVLIYAIIDFTEWQLTRISDGEPAIIIAGFVVYALYALIRYRAIVTLGKYYNLRVAIYEEHSLITHGIYSSIRHPFYLTALLSVISISLIFSSWGGLLLSLALSIPAIIYRINIEEDFMLRHFGSEYQEYMARTKKLLPGIW